MIIIIIIIIITEISVFSANSVDPDQKITSHFNLVSFGQFVLIVQSTRTFWSAFLFILASLYGSIQFVLISGPLVLNVQ